MIIGEFEKPHSIDQDTDALSDPSSSGHLAGKKCFETSLCKSDGETCIDDIDCKNSICLQGICQRANEPKIETLGTLGKIGRRQLQSIYSSSYNNYFYTSA